MRTTRRALIGSALLVLAVTGVPAGQTAATGHSTNDRRAAPCKINDGIATTGASVGDNPVRYEYGNSPYLGARYNSCLDVIKVYYGGYDPGVPRGVTHYNVIRHAQVGSYPPIRFGQGELRATTTRMVWTVTPRPNANHVASFTVQACRKGPVDVSSTCTRWSPTVRVAVTH
jgi:hypothetical protein